jgi:hypothetical protein
MLHAITIREDHDRPKFNYFVGCSCFWEGRYSGLKAAREGAEAHAHKRSVGIDKAEISDETKNENEVQAATQDAGQEKPVGKKGKWKKW